MVPNATVARMAVGCRAGLLILTFVFVAVLLLGQTAPAAPPTAKPFDSSARSVDGRTAYSTGHTGHKLKWLPHRPSRSEVAPRVIAAQHVAEMPVKSPRETARERWVQADPSRRSGAFGDPFGDRRRASQPAAVPSRKVASEPIETPDPITPLLPPSFSNESLDYTMQTGAAGTAPMSLGRDLVVGGAYGHGVASVEDDCAAAKEDLKKVSQLDADTAASDGYFPPECDLGMQIYKPRDWSPTTYNWTASGLCHKPTYFEDIRLERYGHSWGPYLQPIISGGRFFLTVPILPYKMGLKPPGECVYTLGHYRPGNCAPYMLDPLPLSIRAAVFQAGVASGMAYAIP